MTEKRELTLSTYTVLDPCLMFSVWFYVFILTLILPGVGIDKFCN